MFAMGVGVTMTELHFLHPSCMNIVNLGLTDNTYLGICGNNFRSERGP